MERRISAGVRRAVLAALAVGWAARAQAPEASLADRCRAGEPDACRPAALELLAEGTSGARASARPLLLAGCELGRPLACEDLANLLPEGETAKALRRYAVTLREAGPFGPLPTPPWTRRSTAAAEVPDAGAIDADAATAPVRPDAGATPAAPEREQVAQPGDDPALMCNQGDPLGCHDLATGRLRNDPNAKYLLMRACALGLAGDCEPAATAFAVVGKTRIANLILDYLEKLRAGGKHVPAPPPWMLKVKVEVAPSADEWATYPSRDSAVANGDEAAPPADGPQPGPRRKPLGATPAPAPEREPAPEPEPARAPTPSSDPERVPRRRPLVAQSERTSREEPEPARETAPEEEPAPAPGTTPEPAPATTPAPAPAATPAPVPGTTPEPAPGTTSEPAPGTTPEPAPGTTPAPAPQPVPEARPRPAPPPQPEPRPEPTPEPISDEGIALATRKPRPPPPPFNHSCVSEAQRQRLDSVKKAAADPAAFQPSGIWAPPIFMTNAERSYYWAGLLFFRSYDFDANSSTTVFPPFALSLCQPDSETLITPLYSSRLDAEGEARLILTYFQRRDRFVQTDVLFPLVWWFRERDDENGPWNDAYGAVFPFAFWRSRPDGSSFQLIPPLLLFHGEDGKGGDTTVVGPFYRVAEAESASFGLVPLYFGHRDADSWYHVVPPLISAWQSPQQHGVVIPPLLFAHWAKGDEETTWALQTFYKSKGRDFTLASLPLVFAARDGDDGYAVVPPLFWRFVSAVKTTTVVGPAFLQERTTGYDFGLVPLYFRGRDLGSGHDVMPLLFWAWHDDRSHHLVIPPLLTAHWGDEEGESTWALQTYYQRRKDGFTLTSLPLIFAGREGDDGYAVVPPLFWRFVSPQKTTTVVLPGFLRERPTGYDFGLVPLYFRGRDVAMGYDVSPLLYWNAWDGPRHYTWLPPLFAAHWGDGETENTWFLQTVFQSRPSGFTLTSFPLVFAGREYNDAYTVVPPLFFRFSSPEKTTTVVPPVFLRERPTGYDFGLVPLYFRGRDADAGYDVSPLLFWNAWDGPRHYTWVPALMAAHWGDEEHDNTWLLQTVYRATRRGYSLVSFPFVFAGREDERSYAYVPPLFWRHETPERTFTLIGPGYLNERLGGYDFGLAPLYFRGREGDTGYDVSPLLFWNAWEGQWHYTVLPPLLAAHWGDDETENTWALQTYFQSRPSGFTLASLPLLFAGREYNDSYTVVPPLFWRFATPGKTTTVLVPGYFQQRPHGYDFGLVPLYFRAREQDSGFDVSPLLFWSAFDGARHYTALPPLLAAHWGDGETENTWALQTYFQSRPSGFTLTSLPLLFAGREYNDSYTVVPPLFWRFATPEKTTTVVGPAFLRERPTGYDVGVAPLYFRGRDGDAGYDVSPLLFWSAFDGARHYTALPPLLAAHWGDGETENTWAWQTYYQRRKNGFTLTSFPLIFAGREGDEGHAVVPPLFWRFVGPEKTTTVLLPGFLQERASGYDFGLIPLYFRGREGSAGYDVSPLLFWNAWNGQRHFTALPPLLAAHWGDGETENTWALQTYYQSRASGFTLTSLPLLFAGREHDESYTVVPPLFWRFATPEKTTTVVGPGFLRERPAGYDFGLVPLYFRGRDGDAGYDVSPLLFWSAFDGPRHYTVLPPLLAAHWGDRESENTFALQTYYQRRKNGFTLTSFPLIFAGREGDEGHAVVPPLFWRFVGPEKTTTMLLPGFLQERPDGYDFGLIPLYFRGRDPNRSYDVSPLLFWSARDGERHLTVLPPLLAAHWGDGETENTWALQTYYQSRQKGFSLVSFPLIFAGREGDEGHAVVPPLFWRFVGPEKTTTVVGPVFLQERATGYDFGLVPLYFRGREGDAAYDVSPLLLWSARDGERHYTVVPPLLTAHWGDGESESTWALQTYYQRRKSGFTLASLPLIFAGREGDDGYAVVPPLFWRFASAEKTTTVLLTGFLQERRSGYDFGLVPLYFRGRDGSSGYNVSPLLFWSGFDGPKHHTVLPALLSAHWGDGEDENTWVALGFHHRDSGGSVFGLAPLYFGGRGDAYAWDVVPPLFYRYSGAQGTHVLLLPLFDYRHDDESTLFVSPLAVHSKDSQKQRTVIAALWWDMSGPDAEAKVLAPFYWDVKIKETGNRLSTVFPLYWRYQTHEETTHVLLNAMWSYGIGELGPKWSFHLFPLFDLASYNPRHFLWQILAGLIGHETQGDAARWRTFWVWHEPSKT